MENVLFNLFPAVHKFHINKTISILIQNRKSLEQIFFSLEYNLFIQIFGHKKKISLSRTAVKQFLNG